jgi:hypothetical protein
MMVALLSLLGVSDAEFIVGDLHEELALLRQESDGAKAASWYAWQVSRLLARTLAERAVAIVTLAVPPLILLEWLWNALFDHMCLIPAPGLLKVNAFCLLAGAILVLPSGRILGLGFICAGLALALSIGPEAYPHLIAGLVAIPAGVFAAKIRKEVA